MNRLSKLPTQVYTTPKDPNMATLICPRSITSWSSLSNTTKQQNRPIYRCLHHATPSTRPRRPPRISPTNLHPQNPAPPRRSFTTSPSRLYKTVQEARSRTHSGPFNARSAVLFLTAGAGMIVYFRFEKDRMERKKIADAAKGVGKPKVGGKFELADQAGRRWTETDLKGGFTLVSLFGSLVLNLGALSPPGVIVRKE